MANKEAINGSYAFYVSKGGYSEELVNYKDNPILYYFKEKEEPNTKVFPYDCITLKTTYPGLLIGTGYFSYYSDQTGENQGNSKMGFGFDYVTGQAYIPGSGIKGVVRHAFSDCKYIVKTLLENILKDEISEEVLNNLEDEMLGSDNTCLEGQDIFIDGTIAESTFGKAIGDDYITPHLKPLENPVPIKIIKMNENIEIHFRFILKDSICLPTLTKEKKKQFYKMILQEFGVGAKTNTGFGYLRNRGEK